MNKEQAYGNEIAPLMDQIIAICKEHKIAMICHFEVPVPEDATLSCSTMLAAKEYEPSDRLKRIALIIKPAARAAMITALDDRLIGDMTMRVTRLFIRTPPSFSIHAILAGPLAAYKSGSDIYLVIYGRGRCKVDIAWANIGAELLADYWKKPIDLPGEVQLIGHEMEPGSIFSYHIEPLDDAVIHGIAVEMDEDGF